VKSAQNSIELFAFNLSAYLWKGKALLASGKKIEAFFAWTSALELDSIETDVTIAKEIFVLLNQNSTDGDVRTNAKIEVESNENDGKKSTNAKQLLVDNYLQQASVINIELDLNKTCSVETAQQVLQPLQKPITKTTTSSTTISTPTTTTTKKESITQTKTKPKSPIKSASKQEKSKQALKEIYVKNVGNEPNQIKQIYLNAMRSNLPTLCNDSFIDDLIGLAYILINTSNYETAEFIFKELLEYRVDLPSAYIGLGSLRAMKKQFDAAIQDFSTALQYDSTIADAWKRRGQTKVAKGLLKSGIKDYNQALLISENNDIIDILNQRGLAYHQQKNFFKALIDFKNAYNKGLSNPTILNYIGICEGQLGNIQQSINNHKLALDLDPNMREASINLGLMYKELGLWRETEKCFKFVLKNNSSDVHNSVNNRAIIKTYTHQSVMFYQLGNIVKCMENALIEKTLLENKIEFELNLLHQNSNSSNNNNSNNNNSNSMNNINISTTTDIQNFLRTLNDELQQCLLRIAVCFQSLGLLLLLLLLLLLFFIIIIFIIFNIFYYYYF
jgi:tetratricopeptide (TPR) repeat protein